MEAIAKTKYLKGSPRKARLVVDLIRGRNVSQALAILRFTDKRASGPIAKTLRSAIANATYQAEQQNIAIDPDDLWVKSCFIDMGPTKNRRRLRPAPQGRAYREQRHYCHITIQVTSEEAPKSEKQLKADVATAKKESAKKPEKKKAAPKAKKETKKAERGEVKASVVVEAPASAELTEIEMAEAKKAKPKSTEKKEKTKPADEKQQDINEELERQ
jgi:large subunit ribosomal protein L22